jgi:hypothetical protein
MTRLVWANFPIALLFFLAWTAVPLWMVVKRPDTAPDFSEAHAYLIASRPQSAPHRADQDAVGQLEQSFRGRQAMTTGSGSGGGIRMLIAPAGRRDGCNQVADTADP